MQEFSSISVSSFEAGTLADQLTEKSRDGWEVAAIIPTGTTVTAYLCRSVDDSAASPGASADTSELVDEDRVVASVSEQLGAADTAEQIEEDLAAGTAATSDAGDTGDGAALDEVAPDTGAAQADEPAEAPAEPATTSSQDDIASLAAAVAAEAQAPEDEPGGWARADDQSTADTSAAAGAADTSAAATDTGTAASDTGTAATEAGRETVIGMQAAESTAASGSTQAAETTTAAASTSAAPAGWYADPSGRFELRYWDGSQWTEHVSRAGQQFTDPPVA